MYTDIVNKHSHPELLEKAVCDSCGNPAKRWFGSTSVRICNSSACREKFQKEWDAISSEEDCF